MTGFSGRRAALTTKPIFFILQLCTPFTLPLYFWKCLLSFLSVILIFQGSCVSFRIALECFADNSELGDPFSPILFSRSSYFPLWKNSRTIWMRRDFLWFVVSVGLTSVTGSYTGHHCDGNMRFSSHGGQEAKNEIQGGAKARKRPQGLVPSDLFLHLGPSYLSLSSHNATVLRICQEINHWSGQSPVIPSLETPSLTFVEMCLINPSAY